MILCSTYGRQDQTATKSRDQQQQPKRRVLLVSLQKTSPAKPPPPLPLPPPQPPSSLGELFRRWGLHPALGRYHTRNLGIENLYPWQARCLAEPGVVDGARDLLYFAPTSGGKTMVAELVLLLRVMGLPAPAAGKEEGREGVGVGTRGAAKHEGMYVSCDRVRGRMFNMWRFGFFFFFCSLFSGGLGWRRENL